LTGFFISDGVVRLVPALMVIYPTLLGTDLFLYFVGRKYGRKVVEHRRFRRVISAEKLKKLEERFQKWGIWAVFVGRHLVGLRAQVFLAAGVLRMSVVQFLIADGAYAILSIAIMMGLGYWGGSSLQVMKKDAGRLGYAAMAAFVCGVGIWILVRYYRNRWQPKERR
jgi:membrane protein DedA with SNARE-associated domain